MTRKEVQEVLKDKVAIKDFITALNNTTLQFESKRAWTSEACERKLKALKDHKEITEEDKKKITGSMRMQVDKAEQELENHVAFVTFVKETYNI